MSAGSEPSSIKNSRDSINDAIEVLERLQYHDIDLIELAKDEKYELRRKVGELMAQLRLIQHRQRQPKS